MSACHLLFAFWGTADVVTVALSRLKKRRRVCVYRNFHTRRCADVALLVEPGSATEDWSIVVEYGVLSGLQRACRLYTCTP